MKRLLIAFLAIQLNACEPQVSDHPVLKFFPTESHVSKYYYHYYPDNTDQNAITEIGYTKNVKFGDNLLKRQGYNAGYDFTSERFYSVSGDSIMIDKGYEVRNFTDTSTSEYLSHTISAWESEMSNPFQVKYTYNEKEYIYTEAQVSVKDTTIESKPSKVFVTKWNYRESGSDSTFNEGKTTAFYVQGLGFYGSTSKGFNYSRQAELVEQMSVAEFEKRANHGEHRVAWIDPEASMSDDSDFKLCGHERNIADYYNSTPDGRYIHTKRAMMDTIEANLDKAKLFDKNGRLVFRFVVNCEGKAGRFIAEGYDLDYQPMQFEQETIDHLFEIIMKLEEWHPVIIRDEPNDAYFYLTFNITDGEITDILP